MNKTNIISGLFTVLIIGLLLGYMTGVYVTIKSVVNMGSGFLDKELIEQAIYQYKNNIASCFPSTITIWKKK